MTNRWQILQNEFPTVPQGEPHVPVSSNNTLHQESVPASGPVSADLNAESTRNPATGKPPGWGGLRGEWLAISACVLVGLLVALLPHLYWWMQTGKADWIMNEDELVAYLPLGAHSYHNHPWKTGDPMQPSGGQTIFPWLQVIPGVAVARVLGLPPIGIAMAWRILAGVLLPIGLYWIARFRCPPWRSAWICMVILMDHGVLAGRVLDVHFRKWWKLLNGEIHSFAHDPVLQLQWRVNPSITLPFLLAAVGALLRARKSGSTFWIATAGILGGLLFYVMFYYWTAMSLALVVLFAVDAGYRRVYFHVGWISGLIGLPAVIAGSLTKQALGVGWFQRFDMFIPVPRLGHIVLHPVAFLLLAVCMVLCWRRCRELLPLPVVAAAAVLLNNQHILSGLQIENFHWMYVWGQCSVLGLLVVGAVNLERLWTRRWVPLAAVGILVLHAAVGIQLRIWDAYRPKRSASINADWRAYDGQRNEPGAPRFDRTHRVAGDVRFGIFAQIRDNGLGFVGSNYYSQQMDDGKLANVHSLNAVLSGTPEEDFLSNLLLRGVWERDESKRMIEVERYRKAYHYWLANAQRGLDEYSIRFLALRRDRGPERPPFGEWRLVQDGRTWRVWERDASAPQSPTSTLQP